jgi:hypothetical protein
VELSDRNHLFWRENVPNPWNDSGEQERWRPERSAASNSGIDRADLWGDNDLPPEDNELHVLDLLQRLENEGDMGSEPVNEKPKQQPTKWAQWEPEVSCSACAYMNAADQRFCGYCGSPLPGQDPVPLEKPQTPGLGEGRERPAAEPPGFIFDEKPKREAPIFSQLSPQARQKEESDLEFLRYKTLGSSEPSGSWKVPVMMVVLVVTGFVGYRMYNGLSILPAQLSSSSPRPSPVASTQPTSSEAAQASEADGSTSARPIQKDPEVQTASPRISAAVPKARAPLPVSVEDSGTVSAATQRSREALTHPGSTSLGPAEDGPLGGREELAQAERYLSSSSRDSSEAARWLWKAVGKENPRAVLLLSDLYAKGDGVGKSCDQARLLLMVAAKKGHAEAASRLRGFDSAGCQ